MGKIIMHGRSIADIDKPLMQAFDINCQVVNLAAWIRDRAFEDFGITLAHSDDIDRLDEIVVEHYYRDKAEWLREKMRYAIAAGKIKKQNQSGDD